MKRLKVLLPWTGRPCDGHSILTANEAANHIVSAWALWPQARYRMWKSLQDDPLGAFLASESGRLGPRSLLGHWKPKPNLKSSGGRGSIRRRKSTNRRLNTSVIYRVREKADPAAILESVLKRWVYASPLNIGHCVRPMANRNGITRSRNCWTA